MCEMRKERGVVGKLQLQRVWGRRVSVEVGGGRCGLYNMRVCEDWGYVRHVWGCKCELVRTTRNIVWWRGLGRRGHRGVLR